MFVVLSKLTDQGAKNIQNLPAFVEENMARGGGAPGTQDPRLVPHPGAVRRRVIVEAPDTETMLASAAGIAGAGNDRTETLRAFTLDEVEQALEKGGSA
jgi:uncharacterized protein with GYD domain